MKKKLNPIMIGLIAVLIVVLGVCVFFATRKPTDGKDTQAGTESQGSEIDMTETESEEESETEPEPPLGNAEGTEVFAIFGGDSRSGKLGKEAHSDSIMLVHVDHDAKTVKVASIYRDCMVHIEGRGFEKITHAHYFGGPELAVSTINENFELNIENFVTVNFMNVTKLVDLIGGVEIELSEKELAVVQPSEEQKTESGKYLLNGAQALIFSRIRKIDTDYKRTERQREVLFEIFTKAKTMSYIEKIKLVEEMIGDINTNYSKDKILLLLYSLSKYEIAEMTAYPQVFYGGTVEGAWVEVPCTLVDMNASLHQFLYGTTDYTPSEKVQEYSDIISQKVSGPNHDMRK